MKQIFALSLAIVVGSLVFVGCESTESSSKSANVPPAPSVDTTGTTGSAPVAPDATVSTTAPVDDGTIVPLEKLPKKKGYPYAIKTKWPGLVKSPYAQDKQLVDVSTMTSGTPARCPHTGKIFIVP